MKNKLLLKWTAANAFGLGVALVAALQVLMFVRYGLDFEQHWQWQEQAIESSVLHYISLLVVLLVAGAIFGAFQALILRSHVRRVDTWVLATAVGFALLVIVFWPLVAIGVLGIIPGPVEPILLTLVGSSLVGICQYLVLRRQGIAASRWLILWVVGLFGGIVLTGAFFMPLGAAGISVAWPLEVFFSGFWVAGVAGLVSGNALFRALSSAGPAAGSDDTPIAEVMP